MRLTGFLVSLVSSLGLNFSRQMQWKSGEKCAFYKATWTSIVFYHFQTFMTGLDCVDKVFFEVMWTVAFLDRQV